MFRSQEIILREYACTLLKSLKYLKVFKGFFKFKTLNLKSRWLTRCCGSNTVAGVCCDPCGAMRWTVYLEIETCRSTIKYFYVF